jgi:hypothetical protein
MLAKFSFGFALPAIAMATALQAEPVVIKYEGPSPSVYMPGKTLPANSSVELKPGEKLTLLDERGTRILSGPGKFSTSSAASAGKVSNKSLMSIVKTANVRRARTGAVRGTPAPSSAVRLSPNLWFVDISKSGTICAADFSKMQFWRSDVSQDLTLDVKDTKSGATGKITFPKGLSTAAWPSGVNPVDGGSYRIGKSTFTLTQMPLQAEESIENLASGLLAKGCQAQGELLAATFAQAGPARPVG